MLRDTILVSILIFVIFRNIFLLSTALQSINPIMNMSLAMCALYCAKRNSILRDFTFPVVQSPHERSDLFGYCGVHAYGCLLKARSDRSKAKEKVKSFFDVFPFSFNLVIWSFLLSLSLCVNRPLQFCCDFRNVIRFHNFKNQNVFQATLRVLPPPPPPPPNKYEIIPDLASYKFRPNFLKFSFQK